MAPAEGSACADGRGSVPDHTVVRRGVSRSFSPAAVRTRADLIQAVMLQRCGAFEAAGEHAWIDRPGPRGLATLPVPVRPR